MGPKDENTLKEIAKKMSENFFETALGEKLKTATWVESELAYIHLVENPQTKEHRLIKGSIDLVFKDKESEQYFIIDFKTDSTIQPIKHLTQLYFYKEAVIKMKQIPSTSVRSYIFYLRYNKAIELTKEIEKIQPNLLIENY
ncbi:MAG TPA: PD-(D/E)XK nuclease family protein [Treponemataceae bacterium]|nr:PD-(D/E)XK nuclease family protein [Treponemataceae bacterium]HPM06191.1 PD-(D/E)XK nuclease family protein [Treponemataceae bacterium]